MVCAAGIWFIWENFIKYGIENTNNFANYTLSAHGVAIEDARVCCCRYLLFFDTQTHNSATHSPVHRLPHTRTLDSILYWNIFCGDLSRKRCRTSCERNHYRRWYEWLRTIYRIFITQKRHRNVRANKTNKSS